MSTDHARPSPSSAETGAGHGGLHLVGVDLAYGDGDEIVTALDGVELRVAPGEVVAVVGPSGSGKSSLLAVAGGLLTPDRGRVTVGDRVITDVGPDGRDLVDDRTRTRVRRERIGFVFQSHELIAALTALDQLLLVMHIRGERPAAHRERARALLDELGVGHRAANRPAQLSGGERQRVAVARALMGEPAVLLADEPTASLDARRSREVTAVLVEAAHRHRAATLLVTHDTSIVEFADRVLTMSDGRLAPAS